MTLKKDYTQDIGSANTNSPSIPLSFSQLVVESDEPVHSFGYGGIAAFRNRLRGNQELRQGQAQKQLEQAEKVQEQQQVQVREQQRRSRVIRR